MTAAESQLASSVLMIRPLRFESNPHTAASNRFQGRTAASAQDQQAAAAAEFEFLRTALADAGINVIAVDDTPEPHTPDAVFPNNWVSFHADGKVVLYPMEAPNRRTERRMDIIDRLTDEFGFVVTDIVDLSQHELRGHFLEGTGSLVLDRKNHVAYACLSSRTHLDALGDYAQRLDYDVVAFDAVDRDGVPVYHTNVVMNIGEQLAVICSSALLRDEQREAVIERLQDGGRDVIEISRDQLENFAGNMLELRTSGGERLVVMSQRAFDSLQAEQLARLQENGRVLPVAINNIEDSAGGSVRCMLAEIHLPKR